MKEIIDSIRQLCIRMGEYVTIEGEQQALEEICNNELVHFLCRLAVADDEVVMSEINFINNLFDVSYNLLQIRQIGSYYDNEGYVLPRILKKACEYEKLEIGKETKAAQTIVNIFYFLGLEFIACDDDVAISEIEVLTDIIHHYQSYLYKNDISGEVFDIVEALQIRNDLKNKGESLSFNHLVHQKQKDPVKLNLLKQERELNQIISELQKEKYDKFRFDLLTLINHIRVRNIRKKRGLKNIPMSKTVVMFGGKKKEVCTISQWIATIFYIGGVTKEKFVTNFSCFKDSSSERIANVIELTKQGNILILDADQLSQNEITLILAALEENSQQSILLSGDTQNLILFLEQHRQMHLEFNYALYLDGLKGENIRDIFECLCVENDYKLSCKAKKTIEEYVNAHLQQFNLYYLFQIFDKVIEQQNRRIVSRTEILEEDMITINEDDIKNSFM